MPMENYSVVDALRAIKKVENELLELRVFLNKISDMEGIEITCADFEDIEEAEHYLEKAKTATLLSENEVQKKFFTGVFEYVKRTKTISEKQKAAVDSFLKKTTNLF